MSETEIIQRKIHKPKKKFHYAFPNCEWSEVVESAQMTSSAQVHVQ